VHVIIDKRKANLNAKNSLGVGGEAEVFLWNGQAVKVFHSKTASMSAAQKKEWTQNRKIKIEKLQNFPTGLPSNVMSPRKLAYDANGKLVGFTMNVLGSAESLIMLNQKKFRANFSDEDTVEIFRDIKSTLQAIHAKRVVVGDFNDLNVMFENKKSFFIDTDSMQFANLPCTVATERFLDPTLFGKNFLLKPMFTNQTDFYAYAVMLFQSLLFVHPYGGIHKQHKTLLKRAQAMVSVFDSEVRYPKAARSFGILPDGLLDYFSAIFDRGERVLLEDSVLQNLRFTTCLSCGAVHCRSVCPVCNAQGIVREAIVYKGQCRATKVFETKGTILHACVENGKMKYLYQGNGELIREDGSSVLVGKVTPDMRYSIMGRTTLLGRGSKVSLVKNGKIEQTVETQKLGNLPVFDSNISNFFTLSVDYLARNDNEIIGQILENQTWLKVGPTFGLGFYRVGKRTVYFVFDSQKGMLDDSVESSSIKGQLIDAECIFNNDYALLTLSRVEGGKVLNSMHLVRRDGTVKAFREENADNSRMLESIRGKTLGGNKILTTTDDGLLLLSTDNGQIEEQKLFSDTEPFVDGSSEIFTSPDGVFVVNNHDIKLLRI
jgi:serine/threonine protein kinase